MTWRPIVLAAYAAMVCLPSPALAETEPFLPQTVPVPLDPDNPERTQIGELTFRGGVEIEPGEENVGAITGLDWWDSKLYAVTGDGRWLIMTPDAIQNRLTDVVEIEMGDLLDERGKRLRRSEDVMASAIERGEDGAWRVTYSQNKRIWRYAGFGEAAEVAADGFRQSLSQIDTDAFEGESYVHTGSDCASNGVCYLLLRSGTAETGFGAKIHAIGPDGKSEMLAAWGTELTVENFEGIAVREDAGRTFLYIISDNNHLDNQRTLLMKFEVSTRAATTPGVAEKVFETVDVVLETELGPIFISLETERAPVTAANFLRYVDEGRFDGINCYRAMRVKADGPSGFVQCGTQNDPKRVLDPIAHEPTNETGLSHLDGALSMARFDPGTATGDFSIMIRDQVGLDAVPDSDDPERRPGFAVFGYVVDGMDTVIDIQKTPLDPNKGEGFLKGQLFAQPVTITKARRAQTPGE